MFCAKYEARNIPIQILKISNRLSGPRVLTEEETAVSKRLRIFPHFLLQAQRQEYQEYLELHALHSFNTILRIFCSSLADMSQC